MTEMKKHIYDESNSLWYERIGDYYIPVLTLSSEEQRPIGKRGRMHRDYLKEHRPILYNDLILSGQLWTYLADLNEQAQELICRNEEKLQDTMTDEQKELFERYTDCVREFQTITDCLIFQNSFKLGARMMVEILEE